MKRLFGILIVVVFCLGLFGQITISDTFRFTDGSGYYFDDDGVIIYFLSDTISSYDFIINCESEWVQIEKYIWYNDCEWSYIDSTWYYSTIDVMISEYEKYEVECYNDSSIFLDRSCPDGWLGCGVLHANYKYIHIQPTFFEFMNRLKAKMKEYPWE